MAFDIQTEDRRHQAGWKSFVRLTAAASVAVVVALLLMAAFLL